MCGAALAGTHPYFSFIRLRCPHNARHCSSAKYKHFVRECHRRGIAVIQDVVYNHFDSNAEQAQWQYDSTLPEENSYYWYEGKSADYAFPEGGYLNNGSSGYTPRLWEEMRLYT